MSLQSCMEGDQSSVYELAVSLAVYRFWRRHSCPVADRREWQEECIQTAWCAVLEHAFTQSPESTTTMMPRRLLSRQEVASSFQQTDDQEQTHVRVLANQAENALERLWRSERRYQQHVVSLQAPDEESNWSEPDVEDQRMREVLEHVIEAVLQAQVLARLRELLDETNWSIVQRLLDGYSQKAIADELGISAAAICQRLATIAKKCAQVRHEFGLAP